MGSVAQGEWPLLIVTKNICQENWIGGGRLGRVARQGSIFSGKKFEVLARLAMHIVGPGRLASPLLWPPIVREAQLRRKCLCIMLRSALSD